MLFEKSIDVFIGLPQMHCALCIVNCTLYIEHYPTKNEISSCENGMVCSSGTKFEASIDFRC